MLEFEFYPAPRQVFLALSPDGSSLDIKDFEKKRSLGGLSRAEHPLQLYLKAHFLNRRLMKAEALESSMLHLFFAGDGGEEPGPIIHFAVAKNQLEAKLLVPGRRDFTKTLLLAKWPEAAELGSVAGLKAAGTALSPAAQERPRAEDPAQKKHRRLLENVQKDFAAAESWMRVGGELCKELEQNREAWGQPDQLPPALKAFAESMIAGGDLPPFGAGQAARAMDLLFMERRRMQRKMQKSAARLTTLEKAGGEAGRASVKPRAETAASATPAPEPPQKKPGLWVLLKENLWARVGRNATESDELFRQARDRDLWFHVRGQTGGHVWIPRGQPGFGAKDEAGDDLIRLGAELALLNSKVGRGGGGADVDYTERRSLKKIRGEVGRVEILRSKTRYVKVDLKK